jgi:hypothetical protein
VSRYGATNLRPSRDSVRSGLVGLAPIASHTHKLHVNPPILDKAPQHLLYSLGALPVGSDLDRAIPSGRIHQRGTKCIRRTVGFLCPIHLIAPLRHPPPLFSPSVVAPVVSPVVPACVAKPTSAHPASFSSFPFRFEPKFGTADFAARGPHAPLRSLLLLSVAGLPVAQYSALRGSSLVN